MDIKIHKFYDYWTSGLPHFTVGLPQPTSESIS